MNMTFLLLARIVEKDVRTVETFFYRHDLSIKNEDDIEMYINTIKSGKRIESGKRSADHLISYRYQKQHNLPADDDSSCKAVKSDLIEKGLLSVIERKKIHELIVVIEMFGKRKTKRAANDLYKSLPGNNPNKRHAKACVDWIKWNT
jgi:hypothetical protein